jgi:endonuclease YncB( thermonuclease family)
LFIRLFVVAIIGSFVGLISPLSPVWAIESDGYAADVVGVEDGDTIVVKHNEKLEQIRLAAVVCPKHDQPCGADVLKATVNLCLGKTVVVEAQSSDRENRIIANVLLMDGSSLSCQLISLGFGRCPPNDMRLQKLEADARSENLGLWGRKVFAPPTDLPRETNRITKAEPQLRSN